ncbi:type II toxin-antitoxin system VapC family toxin [Kitasatospora sp. NPDC098663]|uniref:type II toxin-antitoxin system VapC family toxin n=1 Tax=Kitasatospora sp. NPDC098663 TaxID=3364096 RepID=UPI0037F453EE
MIYLDSCALLKFIKPEPETAALRAWRRALPAGTELITGALARLEITRTLLRAGLAHQQVPYYVDQALRGSHQVDLSSAVLARALSYRTPRLGSLDALHLASADPFRTELTEFITYDRELGRAAEDLGFPVSAPR